MVCDFQGLACWCFGKLISGVGRQSNIIIMLTRNDYSRLQLLKEMRHYAMAPQRPWVEINVNWCLILERIASRR